MDLAVDEQGLWVLWGSTGNSRRLYAYKIDVYKNTVTHSWSLSTGEYIVISSWQYPKTPKKKKSKNLSKVSFTKEIFFELPD